MRPVALEYDPMPLVLQYHPDIVITEVVERHFTYALGVNLP